MNRIAVVGMGCEYPDARSPQQLWENAVSGRRAFRRIPDTRTSLLDYYDADPGVPDKFYADRAAVLEGYEFDRVRFKIAGSTYRATDLTHWLALDVAARALADAGFDAGEGLPRERTGVVVGNTLNGEFSRANVMRLRWPYVRRVVAAELRERGWDDESVVELVEGLEDRYKEPFPGVDEDTLAGGLANTIAGRICNYFDLHGGGYTVDGACSSSLLSVITAAQSLLDGDLDVAVAGGVDLSIDPFELVGFAKTGALARTEMKLYDEGSNGFWPGEGCGMVVLMREEDALASGRTPIARLAGWGVSSDGAGGMTRPELAGYQLAMRRAYDKAGFGIETVAYFEGHGTGTPVGDDLELSAISGARAASGARGPAAIGSVKAQIGHTKAAAGVAGLIKAVQTVRHGVIPPTIGCRRPHPRFSADDATVRPVPLAEPWPDGEPLRAGVTSMGFGGINAHVVVEGSPAGDGLIDWAQRPDVRSLAATRQDVEVLLLGASSPGELAGRLREAAARLHTCSYAELTDLSVAWAREAKGRWRAGVVATSPQDGHRRLVQLADQIDEGAADRGEARATPGTRLIQVPGAGFLGEIPEGARIRVGLLFPGQGTGSHLRGGALTRHLPEVAALNRAADPAALEDQVATENAQPLTVLGSLAGLAALDTLGIPTDVAAGHSLGELCALSWAGVIDRDVLVELARTRGRLMADLGLPGTMATLDGAAEVVQDLASGTDGVNVAAFNSPRHTVVAGTSEAVAQLLVAAEALGVRGRRLPVSHAFHSELVRPAAEAFRDKLGEATLHSLMPAGERTVVSTVSGCVLATDAEVGVRQLVDLLCRQITEPVRFSDAVEAVAERAQLLIEVGPGRSMSQLVEANRVDVPVVSLDTDDDMLTSYLTVAAATWAGGALPDPSVLVRKRFHREVPTGNQTFLANPAEQVPQSGLTERTRTRQTGAEPASVADGHEDVLAMLVAEVASRAEIPADALVPETRMLEDLHLSSITVGQIVAAVASRVAISDYGSLNLATSTLGELADGLEALRDEGSEPHAVDGDPLGGLGTFVGTWAETFSPAEMPPPPVDEQTPQGFWSVLGTWQADFPVQACLAAVRRDPRGGVLLGISTAGDRDDLRTAFESVKRATSLTAGQRLVIIGGSDTTTALVKTLFLERPDLLVTIVDGEGTLEHLAAEVAATDVFSHVRYLDGVRHLPHLEPYPLPGLPDGDHQRQGVGGDPVLLASGGAKGITAECALAWARRIGAKVALLGRSAAAADDVSATLQRFRESAVETLYVQVDLTDAAAVHTATEEVVGRLGPVTHLLHGAGTNEPSSLENLEWEDVERAFGPKVDGLRALLSSLTDLDPGALRHVVSFGSVIGRAGLWGEAHYAMANAELARVTRLHGLEHPHCRTTCLEWSVWSEVGMGARLGAVQALGATGITAIPPEIGTDVFIAATERQLPPELVVCGRLDGVTTLTIRAAEVPLGRFLDLVRRHHPTYDLVTDAVLSLASDPYLGDHQLDGDLVFPAVMGLEAMAQVASGVARGSGAFRFTDVRFERPVIVPPDGDRVVRTGAVRRADGAVDVVLLSQESGFAVPHFSATVRTDFEPDMTSSRLSSPSPIRAVPLDPDTELYGSLFFQTGRFKRVKGYGALSSTQVQCEVAAMDATWFSTAFPSDLVLGDPGVRDALMHGNQVSVPDATLLPQRIELLEILDTHPVGDRTFVAHEIHHEGRNHVYDIDVVDENGTLVERWRGLHLRAVARQTPARWPVTLLGPHLERVLGDAGLRGSVQIGPLGEDGLPTAVASVDGCVSAVCCSTDHFGVTARSALAQVLVENRALASGDPTVEMSAVRGLSRVSAGQAQAVATEVSTTEGERFGLSLAWVPRGGYCVDGVIA